MHVKVFKLIPLTGPPIFDQVPGRLKISSQGKHVIQFSRSSLSCVLFENEGTSLKWKWKRHTPKAMLCADHLILDRMGRRTTRLSRDIHSTYSQQATSSIEKPLDLWLIWLKLCQLCREKPKWNCCWVQDVSQVCSVGSWVIAFYPLSVVSSRSYSVAAERFQGILQSQLDAIKAAGTYKSERVITSPQKSQITVEGSDKKVLNFCANNYLGLSANEEIKEYAKKMLDKYGSGLSSVRFICGTPSVALRLPLF